MKEAKEALLTFAAKRGAEIGAFRLTTYEGQFEIEKVSYSTKEQAEVFKGEEGIIDIKRRTLTLFNKDRPVVILKEVGDIQISFLKRDT
jgi:hypothetical protein